MYVNCYFENIVEINCDYQSIFLPIVVTSSSLLCSWS